MKKILLFSTVVFLAIVGCQKEEIKVYENSNELSLSPISANGNMATRGYVESEVFEETYCANLHSADKPAATPRTMQMSAYLHPQNGMEGNYFVDKTFAKNGDYWHATPAIYWPVGGNLDFLAFSLTSEAQYNKSISVKWDAENAASKVTLTVPAENSQNDILFASAANIKAQRTSTVVPMQFKHAQAWLEFQLSGSSDVVNVKRIELEDVYNAGTLTINNNGGDALAQWDFTGQKAQTIPVDNLEGVSVLAGKAEFMDMLIPQQPKTAFVLYYTLGKDEQVLSYRFTTDQKTWLMGEKYIYRININANEITVDPSVTTWNTVITKLPEEEYPIVEGGKFSVAYGRQVEFAAGNLQAVLDADYHANGATASSDPIWRFAAHQYDFIGNAAGNTTFKFGTTIDLFGFSSTKSDNAVWGISISTNPIMYTHNNSYPSFNDWGKNIGNGRTWRTLTINEWEYLITGRTVNGGRGEGHSFSKCIRYNNVMGVAIYPDDYTGEPLTNWENYTDATFPAGVVFLPTARGRLQLNVGADDTSWYSSATQKDAEYVYCVWFKNENNGYISTNDIQSVCSGKSVRLVKDL